MVMDEKVEYYKLPFYKRVTSIMMDFMIVVTLFIFLLLGSTAIVPNIMNKDDDLQLYNSERSKFLYNTDLYEIVDGEIKEIYEDDNIARSFEYSGNLAKYNKNKEDSGLFVLENNIYVEKGTSEELEKFYKNNWLIARNYIMDMEGYRYYDDLYQKKMQNYLSFTVVTPIVICIISLLILVPFFNKDGKTLGKMIFKISVVNEDLEPTNRLQIFMRQFLFVLFVVTIIPSIVSLIMYLFTKKGKTLHDHITLSRVIDSNVKKVLINRKDEVKKVEKDEFNFKGGQL